MCASSRTGPFVDGGLTMPQLRSFTQKRSQWALFFCANTQGSMDASSRSISGDSCFDQKKPCKRRRFV
jgi:hypothetical protein